MSVLVDDVVVSPKEVVPDDVEASLSEAGLLIVGASFGESVKKGTQIKTATGIALVDPEPEARTIVLKLVVREDADVSLPEAAHRLELIVERLQRRNAWIRRDFHAVDFGPILYHVTGEVSLVDFAGWQVGDCPDVTLTMVCDPTSYSTEEVESEEFKEEVERELVYELTPSRGTANGLKRIHILNEGSDPWRGLIWAEECRDAPADLEDPTALLTYAAADLTPKGDAEVKTVSGVDVVEQAALTAGWLTILDSEIDGVGHMTHRGTRRLWIRSEDTGTAAGGVELRVRWRTLGALRWSEENAVKPSLLVDEWQWYDMGECRPQLAARGDERWEFQLRARAPGGAGAVRIHRVAPLPAEQYGIVRAEGEPQAADEQSTKSPGTAATTASEGGGTVPWSSFGNVVSSNNARATAALAKEKGSAFTEWLKVTNFGFSIPSEANIIGAVPSFERSADHISGAEGNVQDSVVRLVKGGVLAGNNLASGSIWVTTEIYKSFGSSDDLPGITLTPAEANASDFGVALKALLYAASTSITASVDHVRMTIYYTEVTDENRICFAERSVELRSDGIFREHPQDDVWGGMVIDGFLPYDTPGGLEKRPSRGILIPTQGDLGTVADAGSNDFSATVMSRRGHNYADGA